jgi:hypothetical protein
MVLKQSNVILDELEHIYTNIEGKRLQGVTSILNATIFKDKYSCVDTELLQTKAKKGKEIHKAIELYDNTSLVTDEYIDLIENYKIFKSQFSDVEFEYNEFLVSDNENLATLIDKILILKDGSILLLDFKSTYALDKRYLSYQLSFCKYLLFQQCNLICNTKLFGVHIIDNQFKITEVEEVKLSLLQEVYNSYFYNTEIATIDNFEFAELSLINSRIDEALNIIDSLNEQKAFFLEKIKMQLQNSNQKFLEIGNRKYSYVQSFKRNSIDSKKLKETDPDIYFQFLKETNVNATIKETKK